MLVYRPYKIFSMFLVLLKLKYTTLWLEVNLGAVTKFLGLALQVWLLS